MDNIIFIYGYIFYMNMTPFQISGNFDYDIFYWNIFVLSIIIFFGKIYYNLEGYISRYIGLFHSFGLGGLVV